MTHQDTLVLYQREECPYCQLVRKKLTLLGLPFMSMPVEQKGVDRKELIGLSGQNEVPVLVHGDNVITGSRKILGYLDDRYSDGNRTPMPSNSYGFKAIVEGDLEKIKEKTTAALKNQGFGVLTEIDFSGTLKKKIGVDVPRQLILGACNPEFARQIVSEEPSAGLLLPCNVTIREIENNQFEVAIISPVRLISLVGRSDLLPLAMDAKNRLNKALNEIKS